MSLIDSVATPGTTSSTAASSTASGGSNTVLNADFNTFLQMLTTQMMNQDPLNPIDSSEYASQLATFSSVEQQVVTNNLLESMISLIGPTGLSEYSGWIGREVRSDAPVYFEDDAVTVEVLPASGADTSVLEIYDDTGSLVRSVNLNSSDEEFTWDGTDDNGSVVPSGEYTMFVDNHVDGNSIGLTSVYSYREVSEVRSDAGQVLLVLDGGTLLFAESVNAIRG